MPTLLFCSVFLTVRAQPSVSVPGLIGAILVKLFYTVIITLGANVLIRRANGRKPEKMSVM